MKLSRVSCVLVQTLGPLALSAIVACAASAAEDGNANLETTTVNDSVGDGGVLPPGSCVALNGKADLRCTPGAFNPEVTQATINSTICVRGWTDTIRPSEAFTEALKNQQRPEYGESNVYDHNIEEDHLVALEIGGDPQNPANLWPEPRDAVAPGKGAETKDKEERALHDAVCTGQMTLDAARQKMLADWTH
jgi:hypothetical protein